MLNQTVDLQIGSTAPALVLAGLTRLKMVPKLKRSAVHLAIMECLNDRNPTDAVIVCRINCIISSDDFSTPSDKLTPSRLMISPLE